MEVSRQLVAFICFKAPAFLTKSAPRFTIKNVTTG